MSDKTELNIDAERASFEAWLKPLAYPSMFDCWLAARRSTIQPTARATDLSTRLRAAANDDGVFLTVPMDRADVLAAAGEIERYYGGMLKWKATAEAYDRAPVAPADAVRDARDLALEEAAKEADAHNYGPCGEYDYSYDDAKSKADDRAEEIARAIRAMKSTPKEPAK